MRILTRVLPVIAIVVLSACAQNSVRKLYEGEDRPESEIAVLRVPVELEVMRINGRRIEGLNLLFSPGKKDLHLAPGEYRVLAYYKKLWEMSGDGHDVVKSDPALFVVNAEAGHTYELGFQQPQSLEEARQLEDNFTGYVLDTTTGETTPARASHLVFQSGIAGSLGELAGMEMVKTSGEPAGDEPSSTVAPLARSDDNDEKEQNRKTGQDSSTETDEPAGDQEDTDYLSMLKAYWSQATKDERRDFLKWISEKEASSK